MQASEPPVYHRMFDILLAHQVEFVVIGGIGAVLQGVPQLSYDLDIVPNPSDENVSGLSQALVAMEAEVVYAGKVRHLLGGEWLRASRTWNFFTAFGRFDVLFEPTGIDNYAGLLARATDVQLDDLNIKAASVPDLISMKESANREKDQSVLAYLRFLRDREANPPPD